MEKYVELSMSLVKDGFKVEIRRNLNSDSPTHGDELYSAIMGLLEKAGYSLQVGEGEKEEDKPKKKKK
jgi:hypothetical protein